MSIPQILLVFDEIDHAEAVRTLRDLQVMYAASAAARPLGNDPAPHNRLQREILNKI